MQPPALVIERDTREVLIFDSLEDVASYIEPPDVSLYEVFDSTGRVVELSLREQRFEYPNRVRLTVTDRRDQPRLKEAILQFFAILGHGHISQQSSLEELVSLLVRMVKRTR